MQVEEPTMLTPKHVVEAFLTQAGVDWQALSLPPRAALAFQTSGCTCLQALAHGVPLGDICLPLSDQPLYLGKFDEQDVLIGKMPVGAPNAVAYTECLISLGVEQVIVSGAAASINPEAPACSLVIPTTAIREEGTSYHYVSAATVVRSSEMMRSRLQSFAELRNVTLHSGPTWTTDAVFRETISKVDSYRTAGVLTVEMELSALFALAMYRNIDLCGLLVISDTYFGEHEIGMFDEAYSDAQLAAAEIILSALCAKRA